MNNTKKKENKTLEISLGLFTGYLIAGLANMGLTDKTWSEAFSDGKLLLSFAGIILAVGIVLWRRRKIKKE